jgi:integrase/recombinase XerD
MHKTKDEVIVPLLKHAQALIPQGILPNQKIFKVRTGQVYNRRLKEIAAAESINKVVTSHVARHTFATWALSNGMPKETVQKILGHKTISTTDIYAKMLIEKVISDMKRMERDIGG